MLRRRIRASYTVEAAGVMAAVLVTIMMLLNAAFHIHAETVGAMKLHTQVEKERHAVESADEQEVTLQAAGSRWRLEITAPVFRPEESLRMWSLAEEEK